MEVEKESIILAGSGRADILWDQVADIVKRYRRFEPTGLFQMSFKL
ncbi:hypothetical protein FP2506_04566 [Fulvimarina pelagi HTCC2506]|uniref:Uncharacterized protein n=1 Tax=Fulvimarina pelagi HTCC2506 TaxID=314231 RepID=Q0FZW9_9HYPH|nr:hypothetical protein FP2506_04566 [Fulvimarina pelagi HTCC2506]